MVVSATKQRSPLTTAILSARPATCALTMHTPPSKRATVGGRLWVDVTVKPLPDRSST